MIKDELINFIKDHEENAPWISMKEDGSSFTGKVISATPIRDEYKGEVKMALNFVFEIKTATGVRQKTWKCGNIKFINEMLKKGIEAGWELRVTRSGLGPETRYIATDIVIPKSAQASMPMPTAAVKPKVTGKIAGVGSNVTNLSAVAPELDNIDEGFKDFDFSVPAKN